MTIRQVYVLGKSLRITETLRIVADPVTGTLTITDTKGISRKLAEEAFNRAGGKRVDLLTDSADAFYESLRYKDHG